MSLSGLFNVLARRLTRTAPARTGAGDRQRLTRLRTQLDQAKHDGERLREQVSRLRQAASEAAVQRHQVPSSQVLQQLFAARSAARRRHAPADTAVRAREAAFLRASDAYRSLVEGAGRDEPAPAGAERLEHAGLTWWVPAGSSVRPDQWLRMRSILNAREVAAGGVMLDIGAHIGRTAIARALLGDATAVYAAEPEPLNYACLVRTVRENGLGGLVLPDRVAIGTHSGVGRLQRARQSGGHRLVSSDAAANAPDVIPVPCMTLDEWVAASGIDHDEITFVQIDTQGTEAEVLQGASQLLQSRHVAWQVRIDPDRIRDSGHELDALIATLASNFTHFIDLHKRASGPRVRLTGELALALEYLWVDETETELLLYSASA